MSEMVIGPVILEGNYVRLEPLTVEHTAGLCSDRAGGRSKRVGATIRIDRQG